jgi:hypothetical protein
MRGIFAFPLSESETQYVVCSPGLVTWPFCGQITRFWLFYFLFGLEKNVWPFGYILAFYQLTGIFTIF